MHNVFIQLWNTWILVFCVNDLYIYDLLLQGGTWDTRGCFYIGFQFLWACEYDFLLWLCISLGPFSKFGDECIWLGSFSKKIRSLCGQLLLHGVHRWDTVKVDAQFLKQLLWTHATFAPPSQWFTHYNFLPWGDTIDTKGLSFYYFDCFHVNL
jgi:hypothetical protein